MDHLEDSLTNIAPPTYEEHHHRYDKFRPVDQNLKKFNQDRQVMEAKVAQSMFNEQRHNLDKQMTVKQIVDEEKRIIQDRAKEDIDRIQQATLQQMKGLEQHSYVIKNKNEKLQRVLIEKEASLLELQSDHVK
jgi:hypothetical protein